MCEQKQITGTFLSVFAGMGFGLIFVCLAQTSDDAGLWPLLAQRMTSVPTVAIVTLLNNALSLLPGDLTLQGLFAIPFRPLMWLIGVPWGEAQAAGALMGTKAVLNEYVAYLELAALAPEVAAKLPEFAAVAGAGAGADADDAPHPIPCDPPLHAGGVAAGVVWAARLQAEAAVHATYRRDPARVRALGLIVKAVSQVKTAAADSERAVRLAAAYLGRDIATTEDAPPVEAAGLVLWAFWRLCSLAHTTATQEGEVDEGQVAHQARGGGITPAYSATSTTIGDCALSCAISDSEIGRQSVRDHVAITWPSRIEPGYSSVCHLVGCMISPRFGTAVKIGEYACRPSASASLYEQSMITPYKDCVSFALRAPEGAFSSEQREAYAL